RPGFVLIAAALAATLLGACGAAAPLPPPAPAAALPAAAPDADLVEALGTGFRMRKPAGWLVVSRARLEASRREVQIADARMQERVRQGAPLPLLSLARYPEDHARLNPTIAVLEQRVADFTPGQVLGQMMPMLARAYPDLQVVEEPAASTLGAHAAARARVRFTARTQAGAAYYVESRVVMIRRGGTMFMVMMNGAVDGPDRCEREFAAALQSVQIEPAGR
ncbi:MAG TPA: hypothetical protein VGQ83_32315, partial [Polyangia bacterium]